jgi:hypothetical protein
MSRVNKVCTDYNGTRSSCTSFRYASSACKSSNPIKCYCCNSTDISDLVLMDMSNTILQKVKEYLDDLQKYESESTISIDDINGLEIEEEYFTDKMYFLSLSDRLKKCITYRLNNTLTEDFDEEMKDILSVLLNNSMCENGKIEIIMNPYKLSNEEIVQEIVEDVTSMNCENVDKYSYHKNSNRELLYFILLIIIFFVGLALGTSLQYPK